MKIQIDVQSALLGGGAVALLMITSGMAQQIPMPAATPVGSGVIAGFGGRPFQVFRLNEVDGPYVVPEGKVLVVTQVAATGLLPLEGGAAGGNRALVLRFDGDEVWRVASPPDPQFTGSFSNGIIIPGIQAEQGTTVSLSTTDHLGMPLPSQPGVVLGYLIG